MRRAMKGIALFITATAILIGQASSGVASTGYRFEFAPGAGVKGANVQIETGWHTSNRGLDFTAGSDYSVYLRGWGVSPYSTVTSPARAIFYDELSLSNCYRARADIWLLSYDEEPDPSKYKGTMFFTHVNLGSSNPGVAVLNHSSSGTWNQIYVGQTVAEDHPVCRANNAWRGRHLHQEMGSQSKWGATGTGTWERNTSVYPNDPNYTVCPCGTVKNDNRSNWTHKLIW